MSTFRALRHPPYRAYWLGMLVSLVGTWMQSTAQSFLVYELTGSALRTGFVMFAFSLPSLLFALPGGAVADRWDRRKLLILTQGAFAASAALLSALTFARAVRFEVILALACWSGIVMAIDAPTRQALVPTERPLLPGGDRAGVADADPLRAGGSTGGAGAGGNP